MEVICQKKLNQVSHQKTFYTLRKILLILFLNLQPNGNLKAYSDPACGSGSFFPEISSLMDENPHCTGVDISSEIIKKR